MALAEQGAFRGVTPRLLPLFIHPDRLQDAPLCATVQAMAEDTGKEGFLRQQTAILGRPDSRPGLPAIACPTLVLAGRDDAVTPPKLQLELATLIPNATLVLIPRCGHLAPLERPEAVTRQLLLWLDA
jgi:pimeloyl-ACP methyl ester carboxylesterase